MNIIVNKYKNISAPVKAAFWFFICSFLQKGISVLTTPIFTRLMTTAEYGSYTAFTSWFNISSVIITLNLFAGGFTQGLVKFNKERALYASSLQGLSSFLLIIWTVVFICFRSFFCRTMNLTSFQIVCMLLMVWATAVFNFWAATQRVDYKYKTLVVITIIVSIAKPIVGIILVYLSNDKVTARIFGLAVVELIGYGGLFFVQLKAGKNLYSKKYWRYSLTFNIPLLPHYLSQVVLSGADRIMINNMCGSSEAGIYGLAYSIALIMTLVNSALLQTTDPWIYKKINENKIEEIIKVAYPTLILIGAANIILIAFAPEAVLCFAPKEYLDAIWVIPPVAMSVYFMFAYSLFATFEFYFEKTQYIAMATVGVAALNIILNYFFIKKCGYIAAGYTTLFCYLLYAIMHYVVMQLICNHYLDGKKPYDIKILIIITSLLLLVGFSFTFLYKTFLPRYLLSILIIIIIFFNKGRILSLMKEVGIRH